MSLIDRKVLRGAAGKEHLVILLSFEQEVEVWAQKAVSVSNSAKAAAFNCQTEKEKKKHDLQQIFW